MPRPSRVVAALSAAVPAALSAVLLAAAPARAEPPHPEVDFQGDWVMNSGQDMQLRARMRYSASERKMRIDMTQQGMEMTTVRDMDSGETIMWSGQMPGTGMRLPKMTDEQLDAEETDETKTVGGETCTVWQMQNATTCLTDDNIPLEATAKGFSSGIENLERTAQDVSVFAVPDGLTIMDMPTNMPGGGPKPGQGLPF